MIQSQIIQTTCNNTQASNVTQNCVYLTLYGWSELLAVIFPRCWNLVYTWRGYTFRMTKYAQQHTDGQYSLNDLLFLSRCIFISSVNRKCACCLFCFPTVPNCFFFHPFSIVYITVDEDFSGIADLIFNALFEHEYTNVHTHWTCWLPATLTITTTKSLNGNQKNGHICVSCMRLCECTQSNSLIIIWPL